MANSKAKFSPQALQDLIEKVHKDPEPLEKDWRKIIKNHFYLSPEQEKDLESLSPGKVKHIQDYLTKAAGHIRQGGKIKGELIECPPHERTKEHLVYDVSIELESEKP